MIIKEKYTKSAKLNNLSGSIIFFSDNKSQLKNINNLLNNSQTNLLKNCRNSRFIPNDRQIESIFSIYDLARDEGFSSENFPADF